MADTQFLQQRRQTWYVRVVVPPKLRPLVGKQHILKSLETRSLTEARTRRWTVVGEIKRYLDDVRKLADAHEAGNGADPTTIIREASVLRRQYDAGQLDDDSFQAAEDALIERGISAAAKRYGVDPETGNPNAPPDVVQAIRLASRVASGERILLMRTAVDDYLKETAGRVGPQTIRSKERRLADLLKFLGNDVELEAVTRRRIGEYVTQRLQTAKTPAGKPQSAKTKRDTLSDLSAFFTWAQGRGLLEFNPCDGVAKTIRDDSRGREAPRRPYRPEELVKLLEGIDASEPVWPLMVLALYTGARLNEIAELRVEHVTEDSARIIEGKNRNSVREVPWHPAVKPIVRRLLKTSADGYLISGLKPGGQRSKRGHYVSNRFRELRRRVGIDDSRVNFHTFRNTFLTAAERAGIPQITAQRLAGHAPQSITFGTYSGGQEFEQLAQAVRRLSFGAEADRLVRKKGKLVTNDRAEGRQRAA